MRDNSPVFDTVRPWLDARQFNDSARVDALNEACTRLRAADHSPVFNAVRPWLDSNGFTPERIKALDAACARLAAPTVQDAVANGISAAAGMFEAAPPSDDRFVPLFQRLASPQANPETVKAMARSFAAHAPAYGQDRTKPRIAEFVAQIANETGGFKAFEEDLRYRAATMLRQWPSHFNAATAAASVGKPVEIASRAYGGRGGNAPYPSHDGYTYRGRGALQLTFRDNYRRFGQLTGLPLEEHPEMAADPAVSVVIALEFFKQGKVNAAIDAGDFRKARRITNGGAIGLESVAALRVKALQVLG